ncbi:MAG: sulfurtransferase-like selenium metabolism protein YedF [Oscillospiraceae bacterium]|nr:sulfurtransferase-like selenium metabolism protein YedF [Oscillospiraceae bacterium]
MITLDMLGKPCPIPVIEAKKTLAKTEVSGVIIKVDNIIAVQNLEKLANGNSYDFSYVENSVSSFEVVISKSGTATETPKLAEIAELAKKESPNAKLHSETEAIQIRENSSQNLVVLIGSNAMGNGAEELGKILIKGFLYSLTELDNPPKCVIFFNSGAYLTSEGANTLDDLKLLVDKGVEVVTCGTCVNYYALQDKLAVGKIVNMYDITERLTAAGRVVSI